MRYELGIPGLPGFENVGSAFDPGTFLIPGGGGSVSIPTELLPSDDTGGGFLFDPSSVVNKLDENISNILSTAVKGAGAYANIKRLIDDPSSIRRGGTVNTGASGTGASVNNNSFLDQRYFGLSVPELFIAGASILLISKALKK